MMRSCSFGALVMSSSCFAAVNLPVGIWLASCPAQCVAPQTSKGRPNPFGRAFTMLCRQQSRTGLQSVRPWPCRMLLPVSLSRSSAGVCGCQTQKQLGSSMCVSSRRQVCVPVLLQSAGAGLKGGCLPGAYRAVGRLPAAGLARKVRSAALHSLCTKGNIMQGRLPWSLCTVDILMSPPSFPGCAER